MKDMMKSTMALLALSLAASLASAQGEAFQPTRPVTLVVPYNAGGGTDAAARALARQLGELWKQPVVIDNLAGADGQIGTRRVTDAKPDGYTLLLQVPSVVLIRYKPGFKDTDPLKQLEPVTAVAQSPSTFTVSAKLPVKTMAEFVAYCKKPGTACSMGAGENIGRVLTNQFAVEQGISNLAVANYKGTAPIVTDLIAGTVVGAFMGFSAVLPQHKTGGVRILAIAAGKRSPQLPDVPTVAEAGFPSFTADTWYGLFVPKGTPAAITQGIAASVREAVKDESLRKTLAAGGAEPVGSSPADFAAQVNADSQRLGELAQRFPIE